MRTISACILLTILACEAARGDLIPIVLDNSPENVAIDGVQSGSIIRQGLTITLTANIGKLNATQDYFGVDVDGSSDVSSQLDGGSGTNEEISFTFDQAVVFTQLTLEMYSINDVNPESASFTIGLHPTLPLAPTHAGKDVYNFTRDNFLPVGQAAVLRYVSGNGFSLEGLQVRTVPEPSSLGLSGLALAGLRLRRRKRSLRAR